MKWTNCQLIIQTYKFKFNILGLGGACLLSRGTQGCRPPPNTPLLLGNNDEDIVVFFQID